MNMITKTLCSTLGACALMMSANAAVSYGSSAATGQPYVGVKVGQLDADMPKDAMAYGVYAGYNFDQNFGAEIEYIASQEKDFSIGAANYEYDAKTYGAYGTYRYHFQGMPFYAKGKVGIAKTEVDVKGINLSYDSNADKTSLAGGVGLGYQPTPNLGVEVGYNFLNSDASMWGVGAHLSF